MQTAVRHSVDMRTTRGQKSAQEAWETPLVKMKEPGVSASVNDYLLGRVGIVPTIPNTSCARSAVSLIRAHSVLLSARLPAPFILRSAVRSDWCVVGTFELW